MQKNKILPNRKVIRLQNYKYDSVGAYFITVCTKDRAHLLWNNVGRILSARKMFCYLKQDK